jgi:hypothetical protein
MIFNIYVTFVQYLQYVYQVRCSCKEFLCSQFSENVSSQSFSKDKLLDTPFCIRGWIFVFGNSRSFHMNELMVKKYIQFL